MKDDLISRQDAIDAIHNLYAIHGSEGSWIDQKDAFKALNSLPSAQPDDWLTKNKDKILKAGLEGREWDFYIGGRLFAIREKAQ